MEYLSAYSGVDARDILDEHQDIAVILLDVIMESHDSGLSLVKSIREEYRNHRLQIILRTGATNEVPEGRIMEDFAINFYLDKGSQTEDQLINLVRTSLNNFQQRSELESAWLKEKELADEIYFMSQRAAKDTSDMLKYSMYEIKVPITAAFELIEIIDEKDLSTENQNDLVQIQEKCQQALQVCDEILRSDGDSLDSSEYDLSDVVNDVVGMHLAIRGQGRDRLVYRIAARGRRKFRGDAQKVKQMLDNSLLYIMSLDGVNKIALDVTVANSEDGRSEVAFKLSCAEGSLSRQLLDMLDSAPSQINRIKPSKECPLEIIVCLQVAALMNATVFAVNKTGGGFEFSLIINSSVNTDQ